MSWSRMGLTVIKQQIIKASNERWGKAAALLSFCLMVDRMWKRKGPKCIVASLEMKS